MRLVLVLIASWLPALAPLAAAEVRSGDELTVKKDETIADDLYIFGERVTIDGTVEGDVIAFGKHIVINGTVKGDIVAAGQAVVIAGGADDARVAGQVLKLAPTAKLDGDLVAAGLSLECEPGSSIGGDVLYGGYQALFAGQIDDDVQAGMGRCRLAGRIGGDVNLDIGGGADTPPEAFGSPPPVAMPQVSSGLAIVESAQLEGKLTYLSPTEAQIDPGAQISGDVEHKVPAPPAQPQAAAGNPALDAVASRARHAACVGIVGLLAVLLLPQWTGAWAENVRSRPMASLTAGSVGLIALVGILILGIVAIVVAAILVGTATLWELLPMVIFGGTVSYLAVIAFAWLMAAFLAEAIIGLAVGRLALRGDGLPVRIGALLLGIVIVVLVLSVPFLGSLLGLAVFVFALGGFCLWLIGQTPALPPEPVASTK
jgi:cytoskeletal protein CcmA (bactofilin family)